MKTTRSAFLNDDHPLVERTERLEAHLAGLKTIRVVLYEPPDGFRTADGLRRLKSAARALERLPGVDAVVSFADVISRLNSQVRGGAAEDLKLPDSDIALRQLLLFARPADLDTYVSRDYARAAITIRTDLHDSTRLNALAENIDQLIASGAVGPFVYDVTGESLLIAGSVESITRAQVGSLGGMTLLLFVIVGSLFLSFRCGAIAVAANLFAVVLVFGVMGVTGVSLNVGTCMVAAVTLGIAADDTLHLLVRYNQEVRDVKDESRGMRAALEGELQPLLATSVALAGGFAILGLSSFRPVREFGLLSAGVIVIALAADVIVSSTFLANTRIVTLWDLLGIKMRTRLLQSSPVFDGMSRWQAKKLILASHIRKCSSGEAVVRVGEDSSTMYVILAGKVEVSIGEGDDRVHLAELGMGEVFGEMAFMSGAKRTADVTALKRTRLLSVDPTSLEKLQRFSPYLAARVYRNVSRIVCERSADNLRKVADATS